MPKVIFLPFLPTVGDSQLKIIKELYETTGEWHDCVILENLDEASVRAPEFDLIVCCVTHLMDKKDLSGFPPIPVIVGIGEKFELPPAAKHINVIGRIEATDEARRDVLWDVFDAFAAIKARGEAMTREAFEKEYAFMKTPSRYKLEMLNSLPVPKPVAKSGLWTTLNP